MSTTLAMSKTKENLMRAFAGESQARNRYMFAAAEAKKQQLHVLQTVFEYTANQEQAHAKVFYQFLQELNGEVVNIDGGYPVNVTNDINELLQMAKHNEFEEHETVYPAFAQIAQEEGFLNIAAAFRMIAEIEKVHGERFAYLAQKMKDGKLFVALEEREWACLHCGYIYNGAEAPKKCPVCQHDQGYYLRLELAPYEILK